MEVPTLYRKVIGTALASSAGYFHLCMHCMWNVHSTARSSMYMYIGTVNITVSLYIPAIDIPSTHHTYPGR